MKNSAYAKYPEDVLAVINQVKEENTKKVFFNNWAIIGADIGASAGVIAADGMPVHPDTFTKYLRRLYDKNGLPKNFHLHTLRHYCVSTMLHCGVDKQTVAELVGHGDTGFLERTYCHPQFKLKQEAAAQMAEAIFKPVDHSRSNENVVLVS